MRKSSALPPGVTRRELRPVGGDLAGAWMAAWSPDGSRIATAGPGLGMVWRVDPAAGEFRPEFSVGGFLDVKSWGVRWHPTNPAIFAHAHGKTVTMRMLDRDGRGSGTMWSVPHRTSGGVWPSMEFSPDGERIAVIQGEHSWSKPREGALAVFDTHTGEQLDRLEYTQGPKMIAWAPTGDRLAVLSAKETLQIHPADQLARETTAGRGVDGAKAIAMSWSPNGRRLVAARNRPTIHIWNTVDGVLEAELEGHTGDYVYDTAFTPDGRIMFSTGIDGTIRCWRTDTWACVAVIPIAETHAAYGSLIAVPGRDALARRNSDRNGIELFDIDVDRLLADQPADASRTYRNAKVVLVGDTGVGKSGLGLVLSGQPYRPTDSSHARQVFTFDEREVEQPGGTEKREILLWDLAGQPGYRLIHQLHLAEAAAAVVVFDARSETDPFGAVRYWTRALKQCQADVPGRTPPPAILVAARVDRGGIPASRDRIDALCTELGLTGYFETSARQGWQIPELAQAVRAAINWGTLPRSISNLLFETIKRFLIAEKAGSRVLATADDLFRDFSRQQPALAGDPELRAGFDTCIRLLEGRDLLRRLSFGGFVLLRPELLDAYASALIDAARGQPDGLGYFAWEDAIAGRFPMPDDGRLAGPDEQLLLIATVEELLRHDLALRETTDNRIDLVFPSQFTIEGEAPADTKADVILRFEGSVPTVYATLAVRLSHVYQRAEMWRNASTYRPKTGGVCGLRARETGDGVGELTVFFDAAASEETRIVFEDYVQAHVTTHALPGTVQRERVFTCPGCAYRLDAEMVRRRLDRGAASMTCPVCDEHQIVFVDRADRPDRSAQQSVERMNESADLGRDRAAATATIRGKETAGDYDVFLSYNSAERPAVAGIAEGLREAGLLPWFDTRALQGGQVWQQELEKQIRGVRAAAVLLGPQGMGRWQRLEAEAIVDEQTRREDLKVIPVLLPGTPAGFTLPMFLGRWHAVDFREAWPAPFDRLVQAISGEPQR